MIFPQLASSNKDSGPQCVCHRAPDQRAQEKELMKLLALMSNAVQHFRCSASRLHCQLDAWICMSTLVWDAFQNFDQALSR